MDVCQKVKKEKIFKLQKLFSQTLLNTLKQLFQRIQDIQNTYYSKKKKKLKQLHKDKYEEGSERKIKTKRDQLVYQQYKMYLKNINDKIFREIEIRSFKEDQKELIQNLIKEYDNFDFLDLEKKTILAEAEVIDFFEYFKEKKFENIDQILLKDLSIKSCLIYYSIIFLYDLFYLLPTSIEQLELHKHDYFVEKQSNCLTVEYSQTTTDLNQFCQEKLQFEKQKYIDILKSKNIKETYLEFFDVIDQEFVDRLEKVELPVVFKETFFLKENINQKLLKNSSGKNTHHLCFLVHGLEGNSCDMRAIKSVFQYLNPKTQFILSEDNEDDTRKSIKSQGKILAREISNYVQGYGDKDDVRISLIGHSLGGLIIRSCLTHLKKYKNKFETIITLNSPHLGSSSKRFLVNTGMKVLTKFKTQQSLREMCMEDDDGILYQLSQCEGMGWFKNIILIAAFNDGYVNYESAKILLVERWP